MGQDHTEARRRVPLGSCSCGLERGEARLDRYASPVDDTCMDHLVLLGIGELDVADSALGLQDVI